MNTFHHSSSRAYRFFRRSFAAICIAVLAAGTRVPAATLTNLWVFSGSEGVFASGLIEASDGDFYGTTTSGGSGPGSVFRIQRSGNLTTLWSFSNGSDGSRPSAALVEGVDGNFYGTTFGNTAGNTNIFDGSQTNGTVFFITAAGKLTNVWIFSGGIDGGHPKTALLRGTNGDFYGTTEGVISPSLTKSGGSELHASRFGTVFHLSAAGELTNLWVFSGKADGAYPSCLIKSSDGNFYGTTIVGGKTNLNGGLGLGTVFRLTSDGSFSNLWSFSGAADGAFPVRLIEAGDGNLYGLTQAGASSGKGAVFQLSHDGAFTNVWTFTGQNDGANPSDLLQGTNGDFYGTTVLGGRTNLNFGSGWGTVFQLTSGGSLSNLWKFANLDDGATPSSLIQAGDGNLYGATDGASGGPSSNGTIFKVVFVPASPPSGTILANVSNPTNLLWDAGGEILLSIAVSNSTASSSMDASSPIPVAQNGAGIIAGHLHNPVVALTVNGTNVSFTARRSSVSGTIAANQQGQGHAVIHAVISGFAKIGNKSRPAKAARRMNIHFSTATQTATIAETDLAHVPGSRPISAQFTTTNVPLTSVFAGDGSWSLTLSNFTISARKVTGSATVTLSSGRTYTFKIYGFFTRSAGTSRLTLLPADKRSRGSTLLVWLNRNAVTRIRGTVAGQAVNVFF